MKHNGFGQIGTEYFANALHHNQVTKSIEKREENRQ